MVSRCVVKQITCIFKAFVYIKVGDNAKKGGRDGGWGEFKKVFPFHYYF